MGKRALFVASALIFWGAVHFAAAQQAVPSAAVKPAQGPAEAANQVAGFTAWDDDYLYVAIQVNKPTIKSTNSAPFSNPLEDDAAIVSIQIDDDHVAAKRTAQTYTFAVSPGSGFQLYSGAAGAPLFASIDVFNNRLKDILQNEKDPTTQQQKLLDLQKQVIRVKVVQKGAERAGGDNSPGYTAEIAIPWVDLGGKPKPGAHFGFNVAVQSKTAGSPALQSLSPGVKGASDLDNPSLWSRLTLGNAPAAPSPGAWVSPRLFAAKPVIDGELGPAEWNGLSRFAFGESAGNVQGGVSMESVRNSRTPLEIALHAPRPAVPLAAASTQPLPTRAHVAQKLPEMVMAKWEYWFQADARKSAPSLHVVRSDQSSALAHHPLEGTGPWFSYDRADWHRRQLMDMRQAGVDVVLPVYRGSPRDRQLYADKGLTVLATTLQSMRRAGQDYPQVALFIDTDSLIQTFGDRPDLREPAAQAALYDLVRDFYRRIPSEFRCILPLSTENGGRNACPVYLSDGRAFKELDSSFTAYVRGRFLRDFGLDLVLIGGPGFQPKAALDGYFAPTLNKSVESPGGGWISVASVGSTYDSALLDQLPPTPTHRSEDSYRTAWGAAVGLHPTIVLLDGWNDYALGREIAPSLENGYGGVDITRVATRMLHGSPKFAVKYLWNDVPQQMVGGARYAIHVRTQNTGVLGWGAQAGSVVSFHAAWRQGDSVVATSEAAAAPGEVLPGQNVNLSIQAASSDKGGAPLPDGDYTLCIVPTVQGEAAKGPKEDGFARALIVPVHIGGQPGWSGSVTQSDAPLIMETGSGYVVDATLRNEGSVTWHKGDRATLRLYRSSHAEGSAELVESPVSTSDAGSPLAQDVAPGHEAAVHVLLPLVDPAGKPLPVWTQDDLWTYTARWEVAPDGAGVHAVADEAAGGASFSPVAVVVGTLDFGVRFVEDRTPPSLPVERKQPVTLSLMNVGPQTWKRDQVRIGYHWYYLDGSELRWEDALIPLTQDVPPGASVNNLLANVSTPSTDGTYFLMWDVKFGDMWASTSAVTRPFDAVVHTVQVVGNKLVFADLTKAYNLNGFSDGDRIQGDFDGEGHSFPAELVPSYADVPATPSSMWMPADLGGPDSARHISYRWGPRAPKANNMIVCRGQRIELGKTSGQCRILHLVAATTGKDRAASLRLIFQEPSSQSEDQYAVTVSRWDQPPTRNEEVALLARRHYERDGLKPGAVALYHYAIKINDPRKLVAILLPNAPEIKVAAMTLER